MVVMVVGVGTWGCGWAGGEGRCGGWEGLNIYSIHALSNHEVIPCVFGLLPAKNEASYVQFLTTVRNAVRISAMIQWES